jgi:hypothetical protein
MITCFRRKVRKDERKIRERELDKLMPIIIAMAKGSPCT